MPALIRLARPGDLPRVATIAQTAYAPYIARIGKPPAPMHADFAVYQACSTLWVAQRAGHLVGYVVAIPAGDHMALENIATDPPGQGIGRQLITWVEDLARKTHTPLVKLYTNAAMTGNLTLYPRLGYVKTHRATDQGFDRVYFEKHLNP